MSPPAGWPDVKDGGWPPRCRSSRSPCGPAEAPGLAATQGRGRDRAPRREARAAEAPVGTEAGTIRTMAAQLQAPRGAARAVAPWAPPAAPGAAARARAAEKRYPP